VNVSVFIVQRLKEVLLNCFSGPPRHTKIGAVYTSEYINLSQCTNSLVPVTARSKVQVCGRSPADIVGSDPAGGHGCIFLVIIVCCQLEVSAAS
jgi:hypothetical protein